MINNLNGTITFDSVDGRFTFTVLERFTKKVDVETNDYINLMQENNMSDWLHNPIGPAVIDKQTGQESYFIEGKQASSEVINKIKSIRRVNKLVDDLIK